MANNAAYVRAWEKRNPDKKREYQRTATRRDRKLLRRRYIVDLIVKGSPLSAAQIPESLIAAKREEVRLKREIGLWQRSTT